MDITTLATVIKTGDLKNYAVLFSPESNEEFYQRHLYKLTGRERDALMGYNSRGSRSAGNCSIKAIKKGIYLASRIRLMCINGKISPHELRSRYELSIVKLPHNSLEKINKAEEDSVWEAIGDGL